MDIAHVILVDVEVSQPIEKSVDVERSCRVLDGTCFANKLRVVIRLPHVNFSLFRVSIQVYFMQARHLSHQKRKEQIEQRKQVFDVYLEF